MAYNVYVCCDICGCDYLAWTNVTVSISKAERIAKSKGWKVSCRGAWYCPDCREKAERMASDEQTNNSL